MKYESTILKRLIDTYGVVGNPRYISEIIKEFIVRGKERFPELFTYQADWLAHIDEFGLNPSYTVSYTGQSIYAPNTLERPVKSAILSGQTLVNLGLSNDISFTFYGQFLKSDLIKPSTVYTLIYEISEVTSNVTTTNVPMFTDTVLPFEKGFHKIKRTTVNEITSTDFKIWGNDGTERAIRIKNLVVVEGDYTNADIPYFEGMQSVKMPVLKTTGKNLCKSRDNWTYGGLTFTNTENGVTVNGTASTYVDYYITTKGGLINLETLDELNRLQVGTRLILSNNLDKTNYISYTLNGETYYAGDVTIQNGMEITGAFVRFQQGDSCNNLNLTFQLEVGNEATTYEPYKSNILTTSEDVELRGVGNVKDELNLLTGELTQRVGESVYKGDVTEYWFYSGTIDNSIEFARSVSDVKTIIACDRLPISGTTERFVYASNKFYVRLLKSRLATQDIEGFKKWLASNPLTIQYQLATESVKTVDLTVTDHNGQSVDHLKSFNGGTHVYTSSIDGSLVPSVDISVDTDLEETLKMCSLDGNTM